MARKKHSGLGPHDPHADDEDDLANRREPDDLVPICDDDIPGDKSPSDNGSDSDHQYPSSCDDDADDHDDENESSEAMMASSTVFQLIDISPRFPREVRNGLEISNHLGWLSHPISENLFKIFFDAWEVGRAWGTIILAHRIKSQHGFPNKGAVGDGHLRL